MRDGTPIKSVTYNAINVAIRLAPCAAAGAHRLIGFPTSTLTSAAPALCYTALLRARSSRTCIEHLRAKAARFFSNEINLISTTDGPLQWIAGIYQYQENSKQPGQVQTLDNEPLADSYFNLDAGRVHREPEPLPAVLQQHQPVQRLRRLRPGRLHAERPAEVHGRPALLEGHQGVEGRRLPRLLHPLHRRKASAALREHHVGRSTAQC